jgi:hypothetical protein
MQLQDILLRTLLQNYRVSKTRRSQFLSYDFDWSIQRLLGLVHRCSIFSQTRLVNSTGAHDLVHQVNSSYQEMDILLLFPT